LGRPNTLQDVDYFRAQSVESEVESKEQNNERASATESAAADGSEDAEISADADAAAADEPDLQVHRGPHAQLHHTACIAAAFCYYVNANTEITTTY